jgi:hypothetical protein
VWAAGNEDMGKTVNDQLLEIVYVLRNGGQAA